MRTKVVFAGIMLALAGVGNALAAPPPTIGGLQAELRDDGSIAISWDAPEEADIAYYRVYYSGESILANSGAYDDFEQTEGAKELYVFETTPPGDQLFVAVLAVNAAGEESEFFTEEVSITLPGAAAPTLIPIDEPPASEEAATSSTGAAEQEAPATADDTEQPPASAASSQQAQPAEAVVQEPVELLKAAATSSTGVVLTFSQQVTIAPAEVHNAFHITTAAGDALTIMKLRIRGVEVHVDTSEQKSDAVYSVTVSEPLLGATGQQLDSVARSAFFKGFKAQEESAVTADPGIPPNDIEKVEFSSEETAPGMYRVSVRWDRSALTQPIVQYLVSQSLDGGVTLSEPSAVPGNAFPLAIEGVPVGELGIFVRVVDVFGRVTPGIFETTLVPVPEPEVPAVEELSEQTGSGEPPEKGEVKEWDHTDDLPDAGATFVILSMTLTGTVVGWRHSRKHCRKKTA
ncbi:MAG: fibronectin type III domain-containing protein [Candidatus Peribacteraceae bacterium]|nr:fibronectin type III domain-containing protein [Candidatus Peribacteraceae bacterium]